MQKPEFVLQKLLFQQFFFLFNALLSATDYDIFFVIIIQSTINAKSITIDCIVNLGNEMELFMKLKYEKYDLFFLCISLAVFEIHILSQPVSWDEISPRKGLELLHSFPYLRY